MTYKIRTFIVASLLLSLIAVVLLTGCSRSARLSRFITVKGSDTMVHLVSSWAEEYMAEYSDIQISVTGGGSGTGIAALINGTTDIAASSRSIKSKEKELAERRPYQLKEIPVAKDGIAVVVHKDNPIDTLTMDQIKSIFTGENKNWQELGGSDLEILPYSRESSSGTYAFFQKFVLKKEDFTEQARLMPSSSTIIEAASADKGGIGYVGLGYALKAQDRVKLIQVKVDENTSPVGPSEQTVRDGTYVIARPLFLYLAIPKQLETLEGFTPQAFIEFCLSEKGQQIVNETGYVAL